MVGSCAPLPIRSDTLERCCRRIKGHDRPCLGRHDRSASVSASGRRVAIANARFVCVVFLCVSDIFGASFFNFNFPLAISGGLDVVIIIVVSRSL